MGAAEEIRTVVGQGIPVRGEDIDTDRIIPARYLRVVSFDGIEAYVFEDDRAAFKAASSTHPFDDLRFRGASILVVNRNFGCGSSREHAPQAIARWGIKAIVGESFSDIFFGNSSVIGLPCLTIAKPDAERLQAAIEQNPLADVCVDLELLTCIWLDGSCALSMPAAVRDSFVNGAWNTTGMLLDRFEEVRAVSDRLPYVSGFVG
jgi:3-isopropylmalate/(R)-2-methylmalate dehydratase small subunit